MDSRTPTLSRRPWSSLMADNDMPVPPPSPQARPWHSGASFLGFAARGAFSLVLALMVGVSLGGCQDEAAPPDQPPIQTLKPVISAPEQVIFDEVYLMTKVTKTVEIKNAGEGALKITSATLSSGKVEGQKNYFEILEGPAENVPGHGTTQVKIRFTATENTGCGDSLIIVSNDEIYPSLEVPIEALVVKPTIEVLPSALIYSDVSTGTLSTHPITVKNTGTGQLSLLDIELDKEPDADAGVVLDLDAFSYELPEGVSLPYLIPPGHSIDVQVVYAPEDDKPDSGEVILVSNDVDHQRLSVPITANSVIDTPPVVDILSPSEGTSFYTGSVILLQARVSDVGTAPENLDLFWSTTAAEGAVCSGVKADSDGNVVCSVMVTKSGNHTVKLVVLDSASQATIKTVGIVVWNEEMPLGYVISGSDASSLYSFTADDNIQIFVIDGETGEEGPPCVNDMDSYRQPEPARTCEAKYGDKLHILSYDLWGYDYEVPRLYLWYGNKDEWVQPLIPSTIHHSLGDPEYDAISCEPMPPKSQWQSEHPDGSNPDNCLVYEDTITITIPDPAAVDQTGARL